MRGNQRRLAWLLLIAWVPGVGNGQDDATGPVVAPSPAAASDKPAAQSPKPRSAENHVDMVATGAVTSLRQKQPLQIRLLTNPDLVAIRRVRAAGEPPLAPLPSKVFDTASIPEFLANHSRNVAQFRAEKVELAVTTQRDWETIEDQAIPFHPTTQVGKVAVLETEGVNAAGEKPLVVVLPEVSVRFKKNGMTEQRIRDLIQWKGAGLKLNELTVKKVKHAENQWVIDAKTPENALTLSTWLREQEDEVEFAEPNLIRHHEMREQTGDPLLSSQWHLRNTGQNGGRRDADVGAQAAWTTTRGDRRVIVAILDPSGVQVDHEDLQANVYVNLGEFGPDGQGGWKQSNNKDDDDNERPDDSHGWNFRTRSNVLLRAAEPGFEPSLANGMMRADSAPLSRGHGASHGTAVAGLAVAHGDNGLGGSGLAPNCRFLAITIGGSDQDDADAFYYAAAQGADVICCCWGYPIGTPATRLVEQAIEDVAKPGPKCLGRHGLGCVVVFAMTNEKVDNFAGRMPDISSHPNVIAVGRSTNQDQWGESGYGNGMHLLAPSHAAKGTAVAGCDPNQMAGTLDVTTTDLMGEAGINDGTSAICYCNTGVTDSLQQLNYTQCFNGTSAATPLVAAAAALCLSVRPNAASPEILDDLTNTADKIEAELAQYDSTTKYSPTHGFGRLNAGKAVERSRQNSSQYTAAALPLWAVLRKRAAADLEISSRAIANAASGGSEGTLAADIEALRQLLETSLP